MTLYFPTVLRQIAAELAVADDPMISGDDSHPVATYTLEHNRIDVSPGYVSSLSFNIDGTFYHGTPPDVLDHTRPFAGQIDQAVRAWATLLARPVPDDATCDLARSLLHNLIILAQKPGSTESSFEMTCGWRPGEKLQVTLHYVAASTLSAPHAVSSLAEDLVPALLPIPQACVGLSSSSLPVLPEALVVTGSNDAPVTAHEKAKAHRFFHDLRTSKALSSWSDLNLHDDALHLLNQLLPSTTPPKP